jgi:alkanesulfonate monooxygenase SsuD/methylene tetrahydromethanopterin reductase-like flavin-dependent oxidoreductase (luciferase family)
MDPGQTIVSDGMKRAELLMNPLESRRLSTKVRILKTLYPKYNPAKGNLGTHLRLSARHQLHPSPQRTPVLFQAGTSKSGMAFAARHAEAIYIGGMIPSQATAQIKVCSPMPHAYL